MGSDDVELDRIARAMSDAWRHVEGCCGPEQEEQEEQEEIIIVDTYVGEETTIYYDNDGEQHCVVNEEE